MHVFDCSLFTGGVKPEYNLLNITVDEIKSEPRGIAFIKLFSSIIHWFLILKKCFFGAGYAN